ncbi:predicted protein [Chaetoceros tenuissimus]|uniref:Uncharacterized protein n=1 Tax=Chaetoceros tenuissimus TaxID=426638 RepID=A0AAD3CU14_9STRA|nr:predicted protein [Chaetoceros tenuissimus]
MASNDDSTSPIEVSFDESVDDGNQNDQQPQDKKREKQKNPQMNSKNYIRVFKHLIQKQRNEWKEEGREDWETAKVKIRTDKQYPFVDKEDKTKSRMYNIGKWIGNEKNQAQLKGVNSEPYRTIKTLQAAGMSNFDVVLSQMETNPQLYKAIKKYGGIKKGKAKMKETASANLATESNTRSTQDSRSNNAGYSNEKVSTDDLVTQLCESLMALAEAHGEESPPYDVLSDGEKVDIRRVIDLQKKGKLTDKHMLFLEAVNFPWFISVEEAFQYAIGVYTENNKTFKEPASKTTSQGPNLEKAIAFIRKENLKLNAFQRKVLDNAKFPFEPEDVLDISARVSSSSEQASQSDSHSENQVDEDLTSPVGSPPSVTINDARDGVPNVIPNDLVSDDFNTFSQKYVDDAGEQVRDERYKCTLCPFCRTRATNHLCRVCKIPFCVPCGTENGCKSEPMYSCPFHDEDSKMYITNRKRSASTAQSSLGTAQSEELTEQMIHCARLDPKKHEKLKDLYWKYIGDPCNPKRKQAKTLEKELREKLKKGN